LLASDGKLYYNGHYVKDAAGKQYLFFANNQAELILSVKQEVITSRYYDNFVVLDSHILIYGVETKLGYDGSNSNNPTGNHSHIHDRQWGGLGSLVNMLTVAVVTVETIVAILSLTIGLVTTVIQLDNHHPVQLVVVQRLLHSNSNSNSNSLYTLRVYISSTVLITSRIYMRLRPKWLKVKSITSSAVLINQPQTI